MLTQKKKPINPYNYDPMSPGAGAFKALTRELLKDVETVRGGITFAVSGSFEYLSVAQYMSHAGGRKTVDDIIDTAKAYFNHYSSKNQRPQVCSQPSE